MHVCHAHTQRRTIKETITSSLGHSRDGPTPAAQDATMRRRKTGDKRGKKKSGALKGGAPASGHKHQFHTYDIFHTTHISHPHPSHVALRPCSSNSRAPSTSPPPSKRPNPCTSACPVRSPAPLPTYANPATPATPATSQREREREKYMDRCRCMYVGYLQL